jgi:chromosome segregation ATPase
MWKIDAGVGDDNLAKVIGQRDELAKQLADLADRVEKSMAKVTEIVARNNDYQKQIATLTKRLAELQPPRVIADNAIARADQLLSGMETAVADVKAKTADLAAAGLKRLEG